MGLVIGISQIHRRKANLLTYVYSLPQERIWNPQAVRQLRFIFPPELRRRGLRLRREGRHFTGRCKEQMFGKQMFTMACRDKKTQRTLISRPCQAAPSLPYLPRILPTCSMRVSSSWSRTAVYILLDSWGGRKKLSLRLLGPDCLQLKMVHAKGTHSGETCELLNWQPPEARRGMKIFFARSFQGVMDSQILWFCTFGLQNHESIDFFVLSYPVRDISIY